MRVHDSKASTGPCVGVRPRGDGIGVLKWVVGSRKRFGKGGTVGGGEEQKLSGELEGLTKSP